MKQNESRRPHLVAVVGIGLSTTTRNTYRESLFTGTLIEKKDYGKVAILAVLADGWGEGGGGCIEPVSRG